MTTEQIYNDLKENFVGKEATIKMELGGIGTIILERDIYGNCIQSWLKEYFIEKNVDFNDDNTQEFPDYMINNEMLEIKCFNYDASPAFDVAEPLNYVTSTFSDPSKINAKYLIFGYSSNSEGFIIKDVWLKNVWEITGLDTKRAGSISAQVKSGIIHRIRPRKWYGNGNANFGTRAEFINAIKTMIETFQPNQFSEIDAEEWYEKISNEIR